MGVGRFNDEIRSHKAELSQWRELFVLRQKSEEFPSVQDLTPSSDVSPDRMRVYFSDAEMRSLLLATEKYLEEESFGNQIAYCNDTCSHNPAHNPSFLGMHLATQIADVGVHVAA